MNQPVLPVLSRLHQAPQIYRFQSFLPKRLKAPSSLRECTKQAAASAVHQTLVEDEGLLPFTCEAESLLKESCMRLDFQTLL